MDSTDFAEKYMLETRSTTPLGIRSIFDFNNENIPSLPDFSLIDDFGRESLGIINLDNMDVGTEALWFTKGKLSDFVEVDVTESAALVTQSDCDLNTAFMSCKNSPRSNFSWSDSVSPYMKKISNLKTSFGLNTELERKLSPLLNEEGNNLSALSSLLKDIMTVENRYKEKSFIVSPEKLKNYSYVIRESSDGFNDSVFIEANHLAARFEDGSIYDLDICENDMLDSIQQPEDLVDISSDNPEPVVPEKESIFKIIDKILPSSDQDLPMSVSVNKNQYDNSTKNGQQTIMNAKNPQNILSTLSELLKKDNTISEKQKYEAQNMISNLAAILMSNGNLDDSGHSSIETELLLTSPECYEVLDLRKKSQNSDNPKPEEISVPLDLSLKSNQTLKCVNKSLPPKYNSHPQSLITKQNNNNGYLTSHSEKKFFQDVNKFKLKKTDDKPSLKKGPMRAVVPLDNMAKRKSFTSRLQMTPKRNESDLKKTHTPVQNGLVLKPVAQSTPEGPISSLNKLTSAEPRVVKQKLTYPRSSLHNVNRNKDSKNKKAFLTRRYSVDDLEKAQENEKVLSRSSSLGGKTGLVVVGNKPTTVTKLSSRSNVRSLPVLKENRSKSVTRSSFGRTGKENLF